jgi:glycerol-3-phosphate dehydrogenase (NAD(P)+)
MSLDRVAVVGAGAWGTALANAACRAGHTPMLVARNASAAMALARGRESPHLPGVRLDSNVAIVSAIEEVARHDVILVAVPAQNLRLALTPLAALIRSTAIVAACAKGIERGSDRFMTEVIEEVMPAVQPAILSGPSFAADVAQGLPTAITVAAREAETATALAQTLGSTTFRLYHSTDMRGVEIGGAAKNVLAIAAGIVAGRKLGASAMAALTTRGFAELARFGRAYGARPETLMGLSGLGDLILTCSSGQSRNFAFGKALGEGRSIHEAGAGKLVEGAATAAVLLDMARSKSIDMPIAESVAAVLEGRLTVDGAIETLLTRPFKAEDA